MPTVQNGNSTSIINTEELQWGEYDVKATYNENDQYAGAVTTSKLRLQRTLKPVAVHGRGSYFFAYDGDDNNTSRILEELTYLGNCEITVTHNGITEVYNEFYVKFATSTTHQYFITVKAYGKDIRPVYMQVTCEVTLTSIVILDEYVVYDDEAIALFNTNGGGVNSLLVLQCGGVTV